MNKSTVLTYPQFEPNQVLTDKQLNGLRDYLDGQGRVTRTYGIGSGIVCGLHAAYQYHKTCDEHAIVITPGYGFSSDGYFIQLNQPETASEGSHSPCSEPIFPGLMFTHVRPYQIAQRDLQSPLEKSYQSWIQATPSASTVKTTSEPPRVWELLTADAGMQSKEALELKETHVDGRVLVIFLEKGKVADKPCVNTDCGSKSSVTQNLRILLVDQEYVHAMKTCDQVTQELIPVKRLATSLPMPTVTGQGGFTSRYAALSDIESLNTAYGRLVEDMRTVLWNSFKTACDDYRGFLHLSEEVDLEVLQEKYESLIEENRYDVKYHQYFYDFVRDFATGLNEFHEAVCHLTGSCKPVKGFPRHLALCAFREEDPDQMIRTEDGVRTVWYPSPVQNVMEGEWARTRKMLLRIRDLIYGFEPAFGTYAPQSDNYGRVIKVIPSQPETQKLGRRAIPGYYSLNDQKLWKAFMVDWQPTACCTDDVLQAYAFELPSLAKAQTDTLAQTQIHPLDFGLGQYGYLRIDGHIGNTMDAAKSGISQIRTNYNLEFDLIFVNLAPLKEGENAGETFSADGTMLVRNPNFFQELPWEINGMEHTGGVAPGGTFIVICDEVCIDKDKQIFSTLAVADFSLNKSLSCCFSGPKNQTGTRGLSAAAEATVSPKLSVIPGEQAATSRSLSPATGESAARGSGAQANKNLKKALAERTRGYQEDLFGLNAGGAFEGVATYQAALDFVETEASLPNKLDTYADLVTKLFSTSQRVKDSNKKQAYRQMMERVTLLMFDLLVVQQSAGIGTDTQTVLGDQIERLKKAGVSTSKLKTNWSSSSLAKVADAPVITTLNQLLAS